MWRVTPLIVAAVTACWLNPADRTTFEVRGEIIPPHAGTVTLHAVADPFATSVTTGPDGNFRFGNIEAGAYTVLVYVPSRGDTRMTIQVGPGTADKKRRVAVKVRTQGEALNRNSAAMISSRELSIPEEAQRQYDEAARKIAKRDYDGAVACLRRAVEIAPHFAGAWNHLGTIAYQRGRYQDAETWFRDGLNADPEAYEPLVNVGGVLLNLGKIEDARKYNLEAVRRRPNDALAESQLGMTYLMLNELDAAENHLLLACRLDPDHFSNAQLSLAELYARKQEPLRAAEQLEAFLRRHPDWPSTAKMREAIEQLRR